MPHPVESYKVETLDATGMVIPVSKGTYFNTNWVPKEVPLCPYDMLYHPPDYNPKAARSDRQEPKIIKKNIWDQKSVCGGRAQRGVRVIALIFGAAQMGKHLHLTEDHSHNNTTIREFHKGIPSTTHFTLGRPKWKIIDVPTKQYVRSQVKNENPHSRIYNVLEWAILLNEGKALCET